MKDGVVVEKTSENSTDTGAQVIDLISTRRRNRSLVLATVTRIGSTGCTAIATFICVPLALNSLGAERFGVWIAVSGFFAVLARVDGGMSNSLINVIAHNEATGDPANIRRPISSALGLLILVAVVGVVSVCVMAEAVDWRWVLNLPTEISNGEIRATVLIAGILVFALIPLNVTIKVQQALQQLHTVAAVEIASQVIRIVSVVAAAWSNASLPVFLLAFAAGPFVSQVTNAVLFFGVTRRDIRPRIQDFDRTEVVSLFSSGVFFLGLQFLPAIAFQMDAVIVSNRAGLAATAEYGISAKLFTLVTSGTMIIALPLWAAFRDACSRQDLEWVRTTVSRALLINFFIALCGGVFLLATYRLLIPLWIGDTVMPSLGLMIAMSVWTTMHAVSAVPYMLINSLQKLALQLRLISMMAVSNLVLSYWLAGIYGAKGVVFGSIISYTLCIVLPYAVITPRLLRDDGFGQDPFSRPLPPSCETLSSPLHAEPPRAQ